MLPPYQNEPVTDFSRPEAQAAFKPALDKVKADIGKTYPLIINNEAIYLDQTFASINPARPAEVVGKFADGTAEHADQAIAAAAEAFKTWQYVPVEERARYLLTAAAEMRRRKYEFDAMMVLEVGKSWYEAEADTAEAIDFLEYYARQAIRLFDSSSLLSQYSNEQDSLYYIPLGVGAVIPPWNFACAIVTGMVGACI